MPNAAVLLRGGGTPPRGAAQHSSINEVLDEVLSHVWMDRIAAKDSRKVPRRQHLFQGLGVHNFDVIHVQLAGHGRVQAGDIEDEPEAAFASGYFAVQTG